MTYVTPKTNWATSDTPGPADLNRIEGNIADIHDSHVLDTTIHDTKANIRSASTVILVVECRTSDPPSPVSGQLWLRTDL